MTSLQVPQVDLNTSDSTVVQFKAAWAIGRAIQQHLKALSLAADQSFDPNWEVILAEFSHFVDGFAKSAESDIFVYLSSFQSFVQGWVGLYRGDNGELGRVIDSILAAIRPFKKDELEQHVIWLASEGRKLMELCVQTWGGAESRTRILEVQDASLAIVSLDRIKRTWLFADSATRANKISLCIGVGESTLTDYISLPFYFFHEYLSHIFSQWDDFPGTFSEGLLFAVEEEFFEGWCHTLRGGFANLSDVVLNDVVVNQMGSHRARLFPKPRPNSDYASAVGRMVPWLQKHLGAPYLNMLLLETAAISLSPKSSLQQELISTLGYVHRNNKAEVLQEVAASNRVPIDEFLRKIEDKLPEIKGLFK